ncbi:hypothetical protein Q1695_011559 [Nippostrongylus brasiliensis]|nr:hypothetical protein Q1695_011559 [Nippostrongylus brasiliensis]
MVMTSIQHYWWCGPEFISIPQEEWPKDCKVRNLNSWTGKGRKASQLVRIPLRTFFGSSNRDSRKNFYKKIEEAKSLINMHVDELEEQKPGSDSLEQERAEDLEPDIIDFNIAPYEEELKSIARRNTTEDRPVDDEKDQEELRDCHRLLTKNRHETFVVKHSIEETRKKLVKDPKMERRVNELRMEKIRLREKEVELREKVNKLQKQLRRN